MTVAYVNMPYTLITDATENGIHQGIAQWLANCNGPYPRTILKFAFVGAPAVLTTPLLPPGTPQLQGARWEGMAKRATVLAWAPADPSTPILASRGQFRNFKFSEFSVKSLVKEAAGFYFLSSVTSSNQDGRFYNVEFMGNWDYAIGLNGGTDANLNSEMMFDGLACSNDASFKRSLFLCGMTPNKHPGDHQQEDQFLNYTFQNTKFEGSDGNYIQLNFGGSVTIQGFNSWLHTGQSNLDSEGNAVPQGTMIMIPPGPHNDSVCTLVDNRIRAELRGPQSKVIDCGWGASGHVAFIGLDDTANTYRVGNKESATYRGASRISYSDCSLGGYHMIHDTNPTSIRYTSCHSKSGNIFTAATSGNSMVRYDTSSIPKVYVS